MSNLTRWNAGRDLMSMSDVMDRLFDSAFVLPMNGTRGVIWPHIDLVENHESFVLKAELPGFKPDDIDINIQDNTLVLRGKFDESKQDNGKEGQYHIRERRQSSFERILTLPTAVDANKVNAEFEQGVLTLTLPKHEAVLPKKIQITAKNDGKK